MADNPHKFQIIRDPPYISFQYFDKFLVKGKWALWKNKITRKQCPHRKKWCERKESRDSIISVFCEFCIDFWNTENMNIQIRGICFQYMLPVPGYQRDANMRDTKELISDSEFRSEEKNLHAARNALSLSCRPLAVKSYYWWWSTIYFVMR